VAEPVELDPFRVGDEPAEPVAVAGLRDDPVARAPGDPHRAVDLRQLLREALLLDEGDERQIDAAVVCGADQVDRERRGNVDRA